MITEIIGICATFLILISMAFKTTSLKGSILMRAFNIAGSIIFVVYGILVPALSTAILNGALVFVNLYHLIMIKKDFKKDSSEQQK